MRIILFLAILLPRAQESEADKLITKLGDESPEVRDLVARKLQAMGRNAYDPLLRAREHPDCEVRARVAALLVDYDREVAQQKLEREERPRRLRLVTLDVSDKPLAEVLQELQRQTGIALELGKSIANPAVTLKAQGLPLIEVMNRLGLDYAAPGSGATSLSPGIACTRYIPGARFGFHAIPWPESRERKGTVFEIEALADFDGELDWEITAIKDGAREIVYETCSIHSPRRIYIPGPPLLDARIAIRGLRRWYCPTPIEFRNPREGEHWRLEPYTITIKWPNLVVHTDREISESVLRKTLLPADIHVAGKADTMHLSSSEMSVYGSGESTRPATTKIELIEAARAWCGCRGSPSAPRLCSPATPKMANEISAYPGKQYPKHLDAAESIRLTFHKPVEERFELTSQSIQ